MDTWIDKVMVIRTRFMQDTEKQPLKGGSVLFMTDVTVFYVAMLGIFTNHMFFLYMLKNRWMSVWILFLLCNFVFYWLFPVTNVFCISVQYRF